MNLGTTRLRGRPRNRWQDGVREDWRTVGGEGWQEKVYNREEWKKLLRTVRIVEFCTWQWNDWMNECTGLLPYACPLKITFWNNFQIDVLYHVI
jgi:hypothetical protein